MKNDPYEIISNSIIESLNKGIIPWQKPWKGSNSSHGPRNMISGKPYRGINYFILSMKGYTSPYWMTFNQVKSKGGYVRKGEKSTNVVWWGFYEKTINDENGETSVECYPKLKYFKVFNLEQCDDIVAPNEDLNVVEEFNNIDKAEEIIKGYKDRPDIIHYEQNAYYRPTTDIINMPVKVSFINEEEYYSTIFHELAHSTGHSDRLNREGVTDNNSFGSHEYSKEELVAEFTACFLSGEAGILSKVKDNSTAYIQNWASRIKNDNRLIISACSQATKACDYILGKHNSPEE